MYETPEDLDRLQQMLDDSYAGAGPHLLSIHTPNWRMSAEEVVETLQGMCVLNLATVNSKGEPLIGPVDGLFYRGLFWFGSSPDALRTKHIRRRPSVSIAHTRGEELAVTAHGTAKELVDKTSEMARGFKDYAIELYDAPTIDEYWYTALYWWLEPRKMFAIAPRIETANHPPTA